MKKNSGFRYWLPRILGLFFAVFISIFALDAFGGGEPIGEQILGFLIHMIPSYILILILLIAWKWQLAGGILYILIGLFYIILVREFDLIAYLLGTKGQQKPIFRQGIRNVRTHLGLGVLSLQIAMIANSVWGLPFRNVSHIKGVFA